MTSLTLCCSDCLDKKPHRLCFARIAWSKSSSLFCISVAPKQVDWNFLLFLSDYWCCKLNCGSTVGPRNDIHKCVRVPHVTFVFLNACSDVRFEWNSLERTENLTSVGLLMGRGLMAFWGHVLTWGLYRWVGTGFPASWVGFRWKRWSKICVPL